MGRLDEIDLSLTMGAEESERRVLRAQRRITHLRLITAGLVEPHQVGPGVLVLFEGFDAAGKGGSIRRLTASLDPRHVRVVPVAAPNDEERRHHFLWRFQEHLPGVGEMTVFDRSWYGRLLVEPVEGYIAEDEVERSAKEIVEFERMLVDDGVMIVKFWMHISDEEQLRRFNDRKNDPLKRWKLTDDDWRNRGLRSVYDDALRYMVDHTDHHHAHWDLIAAESKHYGRVAVLETLVKRWEEDLARRGVEVPESKGEEYLHSSDR